MTEMFLKIHFGLEKTERMYLIALVAAKQHTKETKYHHYFQYLVIT